MVNLVTYIIETNDLTKLYNGFPALDNINVKIPAGITGIVGANGALDCVSKTNYTKFLSGLTSEGFKNRRISENRIEIQLKQGLPQEYQLINQIALKQDIRILELGKHTFTLDEAFIDLFQQETGFQEGQVPGR